VVNIPSATQNLAGVRAVGKVFAAEFQRLGFATRWDEMPPEMNRAGHLIAEHPGTRGKRVLLIGHLDTVLEGRRFHRVGPRATGNGVQDMKGGDVVLLYALKALHGAGRLEGRRVSVILTGDEEDAGLPIARSRASMVELARRSDAALAFEAAIDDTATVARRGVSSWTLQVTARTGHSSGVFGPRAGAGAVFEAARILDGFRQDLAGQKGLTCNASLVLGGTEVGHDEAASQGRAQGKRNVIPASAVAEGDLRFLSDAQRAEAEARMRAVVSRSLPQTSAQITFSGEYPAMAPTPGNYALLAVLDRASRDLGLGPVKPLDPGRRGAGDISFVAHVVDGLDGLGVRGERPHAPDEWMDLESLPAQVKRAALLIDRLTRD
jgi:glutamate carboxypeptidase